ncbi:MAG: alpha-glucan family phosphorylase [Candidatus Baltobacteraceae bacterium]|jgi:starch phosphorylase
MPKAPVRTYTVLPRLPDRLAALQKIAYNLWWCWHPDAVRLFWRIDRDEFERTGNSPIKILATIGQERLEELLTDDSFLAHMDRVEVALDQYMRASTWFSETYGARKPICIAYFCAEFGIHESIPIYSGGLGLLAGDHLKSASDLGVPLVGVGLMYRQGYFRQYLNVDGWQQERYPENDFFNLPLIAETAADHAPLLVTVPFPDREVKARVWRLQVGRVPLYLLDTNIAENGPNDRAITSQLYGGDSDMRVRQEMVLGIGGLRALYALGLEPTVAHMNEGHSAFCTLERIRLLMDAHKLDFATAAEAVRAGTCFTTHTPVPAGNDAFPPQLVEHYLGWYGKALKIERGALLGLGRIDPNDTAEPFGMTVLAIRLANTTNGVSKLHGEVSRQLWHQVFPQLAVSEVPITSITNGVHARSWISGEMTQLYQRYLGVEWDERPADHSIWRHAEQIPDAELWRTHERRRERLVVLARRRLKEQLQAINAPNSLVDQADEVLDPDALTIGFARRFATYKRGDLVFRDIERLIRIVNRADRPVQFIFAGKAHPADAYGKEIIKRIVAFTRRPELRRRVVFIEDYDVAVARAMVQGVDVWLNTPRRPLEASGTSGMKAAVNGAINFSVLDGWWVEGYSGDNGWAIGAGEDYADHLYQDDVESRALYELLESEIVPAFYTRTSDGVPRAWLQRMKRSISTVTPFFNTNRMVQEYVERCYWPAAQRYHDLAADGLKKAAQLAQWRRRMERSWAEIEVKSVETPHEDGLLVGSELPVRARVALGKLAPADVDVQVFYGPLDSFGGIVRAHTLSLEPSAAAGDGAWDFKGSIALHASGQFGLNVRVLPKHADLANQFEPGLIVWA